MRKIFIKKLMKEMYLFRKALLRDDKRNIIEKSYRIDTMFRIYDIVREMADRMSTESLICLVVNDIEILESLYQSWLKKEDSLQEELKQHVKMELYKEIIRQKEVIYGEGFNNTVA